MVDMARQVEEFGKDHGLIHEAVVTGRKVGAGQNFWKKIAHDKILFKKVVDFVDRGGVEVLPNKMLTSLNPQWLRAREIMGRNMFGVGEAIKLFGVNPTKQQLAILSEIMFSEATLEQCKETHVLAAVFPLSILEIRGKVKLFYNQDWCNREAFAKDKGETEWQLVKKTPVENSTSKNWQEQQALLANNEETPKARVMVYTIIGHFLATDERLFKNIYVRCSDVDSDGNRVGVGVFGYVGLDVSGSWVVPRDDALGLASARKSE